MADAAGNEWCKLFVDGELRDEQYPFGPGIEAGAISNFVGTVKVLRYEKVEPDPTFPGRYLVYTVTVK